MRYRYFVYYRFTTGSDTLSCGRAILWLREKIMTCKHIFSVEKFISEYRNINKLIVSNFILMGEEETETVIEEIEFAD